MFPDAPGRTNPPPHEPLKIYQPELVNTGVAIAGIERAKAEGVTLGPALLGASSRLASREAGPRCRLLARSVISHSRLEWSLLEQQRTSGGTGAEPIGSVLTQVRHRPS